MATIAERVTACVAEQAGERPENCGPEKAFDDLDFDSLDKVELVMALEEEFDLDLDEGEMESIDTVGQLIEFAEQQLA